MTEQNKFVSIIIPVYNEQKYIDGVIQSLISQTYPLDKMEWIFIDNLSTDKTVEIINSYKESYPITLLTNPKKKVPASLNLAIKMAKGEYIIRMDAHASFNNDYVEKCVYYLNTTDADNVGGVAETKANGFVGGAIAKMLSSKFGVGGSDFRVGEGNKYVDTVPFGAFRREVFEKVGLFNEKLLRSEDNDINSRIRKAGGKIWLAEDIKFNYYCRDTVPKVLKMGMLNGNALFLTLWQNPLAMSLRHFIPFFFLMSLILFPIVSVFVPVLWCVFVLELGAYFLLDIYFSFAKKEYKYGVITIWLYPLFHIVYGLGSLIGLFAIKLY